MKTMLREKNGKKLINFILLLSILAIIEVFFLVRNFDIDNIWIVLLFGVLAAIAETFLIPLPNEGAVSVSFAISLATIILKGPLAAVIVDAMSIIFRIPYVENRGRVHILNTSIFKTIFNISQNVLNAGIAGSVFYLTSVYFSSLSVLNPLPIIISTITYIALNTTFMTELMAIISGEKFFFTWIKNIQGTVLNSIAVSFLGVIVVAAYTSYGAGGVILFFIPLMLARYSFKLYIDMRKNYLDTVKALINAIEAKDPYTSGHASRVGDYAESIAKALKLPERKIERIRTAALLHDIGKIGIDDSILNKAGSLSDLEFSAIKNHPAIGAEIIKDVAFLNDVLDIVKHHHERYDGKGYPDGLKGKDIPIETSILTIADSFDAMITDRPYRKSMTLDLALKEILANGGTQFNPEIVEKAAFTLKKCYNRKKGVA